MIYEVYRVNRPETILAVFLAKADAVNYTFLMGDEYEMRTLQGNHYQPVAW